MNVYHHQNGNLIRQKQINTLKIFNENVTEVIPDVEYRVDFRSGDSDLSVIIELSPNFPKDAPSVRISPPVAHPWVDNASGFVVRAPGLLNYSIHSDLGRIVQAIKRELELRPPKIVQNPWNPRIRYDYFVADRRFYPILSELGSEDLAELNEDPVALKAFFVEKFKDRSPEVRNLSKNIGKIRKDIRTISKENEELREKLKLDLSSKARRYSELKSRLMETVEEVRKFRAEIEISGLCDNLKRSSLEAEETSDKIAEKFLCGKLEEEVDSFLKEYLEIRKDHHSKKSKLEKLKSEEFRRH